jgi:hypothetical protein
MQQNSGKWKTLPYSQVSDDTIWEMTRNWNCYLIHNQGLTLSKDPLNLTGLNLKRDSGLANTKALGVGYEATERKVREKKAKKNAKVVRFTLRIKTKRQLPKRRLVALPVNPVTKTAVPQNNNLVFSERKRVAARAIVKALQRDLTQYRSDLVHLAIRRLRKLIRYKRRNRLANKAEAKKLKA